LLRYGRRDHIDLAAITAASCVSWLSLTIGSLPQAYGDGRLDGVRLHWGTAAGEHRQWLPPPPGWSSEPVEHYEAGSSRVLIS